jgi:hypothetical protein
MVEVLSTTVKTEKQADMLLDRFRKVYPSYRINFDLEDCDNILRVEYHTDQMDTDGIREIIRKCGFMAEVLPDIPVPKSVIDV